jgi:putative oxidoreductase
MSNLRRILTLDALPVSPDLGLLLLRLWLGGSLALLHGLGKLDRLLAGNVSFMDPFGFGPTASLALCVGAELVAALLVAGGLVTRWAAVVAAINMSVAFFLGHGGALTGEQSGELAYIYLAGFVTIAITGPGRFSLDRTVFAAAARR